MLLIAVALSRLPFLGTGYGVNVDAWHAARVARQLSETGLYEVSAYLLDRDEVVAAIQGGHRIFYLPSIRFFNVQVNGTDLARYGQDLLALYQAEVKADRTR